MDSLNESPVFICGHRRSGTTLLSSLLDNHPELLVYPGESGFFYAYYPVYEDVKYSNQNRLDRVSSFCIQNIRDHLATLSMEQQERVAFSCDDLQKEFIRLGKQGGYSSKELLLSLFNALKNVSWDKRSPKFWVEKTTSNEIYAAEMLKWFPSSKFIHVIRDPRDNWASLKSGWDVRMKNYNDSIEHLMHSMLERGKFGYELSVKNKKRFGDCRYMVIKYEDLVRNTAVVMSSICEFIGISYSPNVLQSTVFGEEWSGNSYQKKVYNEMPSVNLGSWPDRITVEEAQLIEYYFDDYMKIYGYELCFSLDERIDAAVNHYKWYNYS